MRQGLLGSKRSVLVGLVIWLCVSVIAACGGEADPTTEANTADSADVGKSLQAQGWVVTLADQPELHKEVGSGTGAGVGMGTEGVGRSGVKEAEGLWLVLPVELSNETGDLALFPMKLTTVADGQGNSYALQPMPVHSSLVWADERWGKIENQLVNNVLEAEVTYEGPLVYDVAEDATGLKLIMEGTDETFNLGF